MKYQDFKAYFGAAFQGMYDFMTNIIDPIATLVEKGNEHNQNYAVTDYVQICKDANINAIFDFGKYNVGGAPVSVFEVVLDDNCIIARARKNIQTVIRRMIGTFSGSFIVFHYADNSSRNDKDTWRFSWVMKEDSQKHSTQAKRYTYLCGPSYSCRTIAERFNVLFTEKNKTLDSITKAFDVEALSDEFFDEYKVLYDDIVQWITGQRIIKKDGKWKLEGHFGDGQGNDVLEEFKKKISSDEEVVTKAVRDYVKKLMGRLVFIQFLQKKEWLKIDDTISTNFLLDLFNVIDEHSRDNFIETALERVVYLLLNNENREKDSEKIDDHVLEVPFLNGGLFERDQYDNLEIKLPKEFFHNETCKEEKRELSETKLRDNDNFFTQCGILDLFNQYNFTIDENDPNDAEVGVDPEMLGKIFENLLEDNKDKGAFYTPKEIVQYMCNESLIAYLQTKVPNHDDEIRQFVLDAERKDVPFETNMLLNAIKEVKICDPAIGSGAFPMGLLNLLVALREKLESSTQRVELKKSIIQNNIYGVDIEKGAIDIARLRFWLSIMVDEENPTPLPNFEYKFMQGNSLLTTFDLQYVDIKQAKQNVTITKQINEKKKDLLVKKMDFYRLSGEDKYKKEVEIKLLIVDILKLRLGFEQASVEQQDTTRQMELFAAPDMPQNNRSQKKIQEVKAAQKRVQRLIEKLLEIEKQLKDETKTWEERAKTDILFFDWEICFAEIFPQDKTENERGFDIVIGNPPYKIVAKEDPTNDIYKFKYNVVAHRAGGKKNLFHLFFEQGINLTKRQGCLSYITPDTYLSGNDTKSLREFLVKNTDIKSIVHYTEKDKVFKNVTQAVAIIVLRKQNHGVKFTIFSDGKINEIRYENLTKTNKYIFKGSNCIIEKMKEQLQTFEDVCDGYKGDVNLGTKKAFFTNEKNTETLPLIRGDQIQKFCYESGNEYCLLSALAKNHTKKERIVFKEVANMGLKYRIKGTILKNVICGDTCNVIFSKGKIENEFILAILNSKIVNYYFKFFNQTNHVPIGELKRIPFPTATIRQRGDIIRIVEKIFETKIVSSQADTKDLEAKIDVLVYLLYGLTWNEVQIVENSLSQVQECGETEDKKKKGKNKAQSKPTPKLNIDKDTYLTWLNRYQKNGELPSEEEMESLY